MRAGPRGGLMDKLDYLIAVRGEIANGWCKNALEDEHGNVCLVGASGRVVAGSARLVGGSGFYRDLSDAVYARSGQRVPVFNNDPSTTKADVLALLDGLIIAEAVNV